MDYHDLDTETQEDGELTEESIELSDVIEVIETDPDFQEYKEPIQSSAMFNGGGEIPIPQQPTANQASQYSSLSAKKQARIRIVEQPASKALRFRYECEGRSAGSIPGARSTPENKSYPTIRVEGYKGRAVVVVSCVTRDQPYRPHPYKLVSKANNKDCEKGIILLNNVSIDGNNTLISFKNVGIQCVKRAKMAQSLEQRQLLDVDPFLTGFSHRNQPTSIDLNVVRLCFQVFLEGDTPGKFSVTVPPVVSDPIYDKKAMSDLTIVKLSDCSSYVDGGRKDIVLLCEKVLKEDIQVRFFEENGDWEAFAEFQPSQVHKQHAIWFRTPKYKTTDVTDVVKVFIQLRRPSDGATSDALPFELHPIDSGRPPYWSFRRTLAKKGNYNLFDSILANDAKLMTKRQLSLTNDVGWKETILPKETVLPATNLPNIDDEVILLDKSVDQNANDVGVIQIVSEIPIDWNTATETNNNQIIPENMDYSELKLDKNDSILTNVPDKVEEKSFNELINQVAELDEIYSDTKNRLLTQPITEYDKTDLPYNDSFDDAKTYSSLQLAFKNPVDIISRPSYPPKPTNNSTISNKRENDAEKLPPLPPKRTKKLETFIGSTNSLQKNNKPDLHTSNSSIRTVSRTNSFNLQRPKSQQELSPPEKHLPPTPNYSTLPNPKKRGFFSKLFRKGKSKSANPSREPSVSPSTKTITSTKSLQVQNVLAKSSGNISTHSSNSIRIPLKDSPPNSNENLTNNDVKDTINISSDDIEMNLDLTEAEHYALYTAIAPHATQSEFDEMSCYYAPVEGGKLLTNAEVLARLASKT
ncbi:embryonic polarity protein dorsal-like isoform X1 [Diorhabda carinulata]|uniref:embryonic polarity protein dorsal-like isoform X1 n=2 Tax=Diorhabda carinulata TaxID=1163345 RepID=UPI00259FF428|nr:embryonic polarity protein dorsal-like isoform X1 [Diorhabda carinulata]